MLVGVALGERVLEREAAARVGEAVAVAVPEREAWLRVAEEEGLGGARERELEAVAVPLGVTAREAEALADTGVAPALRDADAEMEGAVGLVADADANNGEPVAATPVHVTVDVATGE